MRRIAIYSPIIVGTFLIGIAVNQIWSFIRPASTTCQGKPAPYVILRDNGLHPFIAVGITEGVRKQDLCATLRQVADQHQNDPAREYWFEEHLTIRAYLMKGGGSSYFQAATLYRYIPIKYPREAAQKDSPREDLLYTSLWLARRSL